MTARPSPGAVFGIIDDGNATASITSDDSVDLVLGTDFSSLAHSDNIDTVLATLRPGANEPADSSLVAKIHSSSC